jgi:biotin synthase
MDDRILDIAPTSDDPITFVDKAARAVLDGRQIDFESAVRLIRLGDTDAWHLISWANRIREHFRGNQVHLCSIVNAKSGACPEDCKFCAQSAHYTTGVQIYPFLDRDDVIPAAQEAKKNHAQALGLVAAWRGLREGPLLERVVERIRDITESGTVRADASLGIIEKRAVAQRLKDAGLVAYNHNLETARSYYPRICSTHTYDDRVRTVEHCKAVGLKVCCGGIVGMGETREQRVELALELRALDVDIVPLNFLHPIPGTPLAAVEPLTPMECLKTIAVFRFVLPNKEIMVAGGREKNLRDLQSLMFTAGASATMVGNYLTTTGRSADDDLRLISDLGLTWEWTEH